MDEQLHDIWGDIYSPEDQPISEEQKRRVKRAYALFAIFKESRGMWQTEAEKHRDVRKLKDDTLAETAPRMNTLNSTIDNVIADQMDNMPSAIILPETSEVAGMAEMITDVVKYCLDGAAFEETYQKVMEDSAVIGTGIIQTFWDEEADAGKGMASVQAWKPENFYPDPLYEDWQDGRAVYKTTYTTWGWIKEHYPEQAHYVGADEFAERREGGRSGERIDEECMLLEYWWREYDHEKKRHCVHTMLMCGRALLEDSYEEDKSGVYAHGEYPFIPFYYRLPEKSAFGRGMMDDYAGQWQAICRYARYIDTNARQSSRTRFLIRKGQQNEDLADYEKDFIEVDNMEFVKPFQTNPLNPQVQNFMTYLADTMKQDSGQNQFSRGEGGMGVTAAGAIQALQEAGGKTTRMHTNTYKEAFRKVVVQLLWVLSERMDEERMFLITGNDSLGTILQMKERNATIKQIKLMPAKGNGVLPPPPYSVRVQVQKRNPLEMQAWNEQIGNIVNLCAQAGTPLPPVAVVSLMRGIEEKQSILRMLQENDHTQEQLQAAIGQAQQATAEMEDLRGQMNALQKITAKQNEYIAQQPGQGDSVI